VGHPSEALGVGQDVEVEITKLERGADRKSTRISLSLRALQEDPWLAVASKFGVGTRAKGKAVRLDTFGAFVELAPGVDGLLHVSQLREHPKAGGRQLRHAKDVLGVGEELDVVILEVDRERRRLSLGLASGDEEESGPAPTEPAKSFGTFGDLLAKARPSKGKKA
jgi:small subunit ribosomal protein S1